MKTDLREPNMGNEGDVLLPHELTIPYFTVLCFYGDRSSGG